MIANYHNDLHEPEIVTEDGITYSICPNCRTILTYYYDPESHESIYPNKCPSCEIKLMWKVDNYYLHEMTLETMKKIRNREKYEDDNNENNENEQ